MDLRNQLQGGPANRIVGTAMRLRRRPGWRALRQDRKPQVTELCHVDVDDDTEHAEVSKVVLAIEHEDIHLARDDRGGFLIYDEQMERLNDDVDQAAARAITVAEDRTAWPPADEHDWEEGPDPLRFPYLYDDEPGDEDDEYEPLDLHDSAAGRA
jgi:hypothetical protein